MSMFKMPKTVAQKIVKMQRRFFWGSSARDHMLSPSVKWSSIVLLKNLGGLGVGNILHKNLILLFKWWWRFSGSDNVLWKRILISIYNIKSLKATTESFGKIKKGTWAQMMSNDPDTKKIRDIVEDGMQITVGTGDSTRFWHEKWSPVGPLRVLFPRLFSLSIQENATINQMGVWGENEWIWQFRWRRNLYDWERVDLERVHLMLAQACPKRNTRDGVNWHGVEGIKFPTREIGEKLYEEVTPVLSKAVASYIWSIKVPPRVHLTIWLACLEKLKSGDFLVEKGIIEARHALCPFCSGETESNPHVLFTCHVSWYVWMKVLQWWGISGVLPNQCTPFALALKCLAPKRSRGKVWNLIWGCTLWSLWFERNKIKFDNGTLDADLLVYTVKVRVAIWVKEMLGLDLPPDLRCNQ